MSSISEQLREAIASQGLTLYGASQVIGAETDEELKTIHKRLTKYTSDRPPESIRHLEECLNALGYDLKIVKR